MKLADITVEVRDINLQRIGTIRHEELDLTGQPAFNNVGTWTLKLAAEHPLTSALRAPGSGIIVTGPSDVLWSGPTVKPEFASTPTDPGGTVTFEGVTDEIVLADMLSLPDPTNPDGSTQTASHDTRSGNAETVIHAYVNANIGPAAPIERRKFGLTMGADLGRGPLVKKSPRFPVLGTLLTEIAVVGSIGFRVVQRGDVLVFETFQVIDRSTEIRLDVHNNTLSGQRVAVSPPGATRVIVAGQGELTERTFLSVDNAISIAAEAEWGRRIERFVDQRNTDDLVELQQSGDEVLAEEGFTSVAVQAVPTEDGAMRFGIDWFLGDRVGVVVESQELTSVATAMLLRADSEGFKLGVILGDPAGFDPSIAISKRVQDTETRISELERNAEAGDYALVGHNHDSRYFTEGEADTRFAPVAHTHATQALIAFRVRATVNQPISTTTWTKVTFGLAEYNVGEQFASSQFVAPVTGVYSFATTVAFAGHAAGVRYARFAINGEGQPGRVSDIPGAGVPYEINLATDLLLAGGDVVTVQAYQSTGVSLALNVSGADHASVFCGHIVGVT